MEAAGGENDVARQQCVRCKGEFSSCKVCSACGVAYYCSKNCQKAAWPTHKSHCEKVRVQREILSALRSRLATVWESEEAFTANMGRYVDLREAGDYSHARHVLAVELFAMGSHEYNVGAFEAAEKEFSDLVKMSWNVRRGIHTLYPFALIQVGKIQEAYDFTKWSLLHYPLASEYEKSAFVEKVSRGKDVFLVNEDILEDLSNDQDVLCNEKLKITTNFWLTLVVIKSALISGFGKVPKLGSEEKKRQEAILFKYCQRLQKNNMYLLKDLVDSWANQDDTQLTHPYFYSSGTKGESQTFVAVAYLAAGRTRAVEYISKLLPKLPKHKTQPKIMRTGDGLFASVLCHSPFLTERIEKSMGMLHEVFKELKTQ